eukprot:TRINITY_DN13646_c0_g2_i1.p1 TRINITY_DN13646_c0_g2~~TRINITY_DN13646_c0_g2_i1.p1  ORF type:complete len:165 (-),score=39.68 TRINITY_DN13646_c0_g2_i1:326-820(-)
MLLHASKLVNKTSDDSGISIVTDPLCEKVNDAEGMIRSQIEVQNIKKHRSFSLVTLGTKFEIWSLLRDPTELLRKNHITTLTMNGRKVNIQPDKSQYVILLSFPADQKVDISTVQQEGIISIPDRDVHRRTGGQMDGDAIQLFRSSSYDVQAWLWEYYPGMMGL